jgi:hypothetical protein
MSTEMLDAEVVRTVLLLPPSSDQEITLMPEPWFLEQTPVNSTVAVEPGAKDPAPDDAQAPTTESV